MTSGQFGSVGGGIIVPYSLKSDDGLGCIFIRWRGTFSSEEGSSHYREISKITGFQQGSYLFHDVRLVDVNVPASEIRDVAKAAPDKQNFDGIRKVAILTSSDMGFGMMRMLATMRERPDLVLKVFRRLDEANAWLGLPESLGDPFEDMAWD
jgi:hypothetical protein